MYNQIFKLLQMKTIKKTLLVTILSVLFFMPATSFGQDSFENIEPVIETQEYVINDEVAEGEYWPLIIAALVIDVQFGQNQIIDGVHCGCCLGGICHIGIGGGGNQNNSWEDVDLDNSSFKTTKLGIDAKGNVFLVVPKNHEEVDKISKPYTAKSQTDIDKPVMDYINKKLKDLKIKKSFIAKIKGEVVTPFTVGNYILVPLN